MTPAELAELGPILNRLVPAIKAATGVQRVYFLALMERAPHFHLWLVPKNNEGELRGVAYLAQQPPLTAFVQRGRSDVAQDPRAVRAILTASSGNISEGCGSSEVAARGCSVSRELAHVSVYMTGFGAAS